MALDGFVKIDGIEGESTDAKYQGWIETLYFESEINQKISSTASSAGGASAERADFGDFVFIKHLDKASPKLALACAADTHIALTGSPYLTSSLRSLSFKDTRLPNLLRRILFSWRR